MQQPLFELGNTDGEEPISALGTIHRAEDGFIGFARKGDRGFENLFSLQMPQVEAMFPEIVSWLVRDSYFTVNGMYKAAPFTSRATGLPGVLRKESHLKYLNACYVDLDVGRIEGDRDVDPETEPEKFLTWRDAAAHLGNMMDAGELPQASLFARSGRGLYVFWLLHDEDAPDQPPRAWPESVAAYKRLQRFIQRRLEHLAADKSTVDAALVLRVPGTVHSRTRIPAIYLIQKDALGRPYSYTLRELADWFAVRDVDVSLPAETRALAYGVDWTEVVEGRSEFESPESEEKALPQSDFGRAVVCQGSVPARVNGAQVRAARRAQDLASLEQWRGGWAKGQRKFHLTLYAAFLRAAGNDRRQVLEAVRVMAHNCRPAYPSDFNDTPLKGLVAEVFREQIRVVGNARLCKQLRIDAKLARELELLTIVPIEIAEERKPPPGGQRELERQARHDFMRSHIAEYGCASARHMAETLEQAGFDVSRRTVNDDLNALGYATEPSRRAGRRPKTQRTALEAAQTVLGFGE